MNTANALATAATTTLPLRMALTWVLAILALGVAGLARPNSIRLVARTLFAVGALACLGLAVLALGFLLRSQTPEVLILPLGLPDLPFHVRLDTLSAFFLLVLGLVGAGISSFSAGYFRAGEGTAPGLMGLHYHVFLASMGLVMLANDAYLFMVAWETMALSSFFLVVTQHRRGEIRKAGFLYLLMAHLGALCILFCFGLLHGGHWQFTFDAMRAARLAPAAASWTFVLALAGFGAKAGLVPFHVWLPEAHPAAPSPVSAMMSGLMLSTAAYGMVRVTFDLLQGRFWQWGLAMLAVGLFSALYGAIFAGVQTDMKRLLAYSSIENMGIVFSALGLALLFASSNMPLLAALALTAALIHTLNHALFKSLLFLATGSVMHATRQRSLGKLGGLIGRMPWVAGLALLGTLAIAGLPPLNGFVSEWLLLQSFLFTASLPHAFINMLVPLGAAVLALTLALAAYVMVKFYGIVFLGQPRESSLLEAHDANWVERAGLGWLGLACLLIGIMPQLALRLAAPVTAGLVGASVSLDGAFGWIAPVAAQQAAYNGLVLFVGILAIFGVTFLLVRLLAHGRLRRAAAWDCGYRWQTPRMQDSAEGFGQPIRHIFGPFFRMRRHLPAPEDPAPRYEVVIEDRLWRLFYAPLGRAVDWLADAVGVLQSGRLSIYLLFSFATLLLLLVFVL